ncbi:MAG: BrnT family toxin [Elstera sp.]
MKNIFESLIDYRPEGFQWDEVKNERNIEKHFIDFDTAIDIFLNPILLKKDTRRDYGEDRFLALGIARGVVLYVVFADRPDGVIRIISAWKGGSRAERIYRAALLE